MDRKKLLKKLHAVGIKTVELGKNDPRCRNIRCNQFAVVRIAPMGEGRFYEPDESFCEECALRKLDEVLKFATK